MPTWTDADAVVIEEPSQLSRSIPDDAEAEADARTALEHRANVLSLDELQARRRMLIERNAKLFALYGNFGHYDDHRKRMAEALKIKARMELSAGRDKKPAEAEIDAAAYGSDDYQKFLDNALGEKIEYLKIAAEVGEIEEAIRSREIEMRAYAAEMMLR